MHRFVLCAVAGAAMACYPVPPLAAQSVPARDISPSEFRQVLARWAGALESGTDRAEVSAGGKRALQVVDSAGEQQLTFLYEQMPRGQRLALRIAVDRMNAGREHGPNPGPNAHLAGIPASGEPPNAALSAPLFTPRYPSGGTYQAFVATLSDSGLGALADSNGDGRLNDERCSDEFSAGVGIAAAVARATLVVFESICEVIPSPGKEVCYAARVIASAFDAATATVEAQCAYQDGAVDSAEIQAAYQNTKAIYANLSAHDANLEAQATDIKTRVMTHDTAVRAAVATHDGDIKDLLGGVRSGITNVQTTVDNNQTLALRLMIEQELLQSGRGGIGLFELPNAAGGYLEDVLRIVMDTIQKFRAANQSVGSAENELAIGEAARSSGDYKKAFTSYRNAYRLAVQ